MALLVLVIGLVALALFALHFGSDSRDGFAPRNLELDTIASRRRDFASDDTLARETLAARARRLAGDHVVPASFEHEGVVLDQAA